MQLENARAVYYVITMTTQLHVTSSALAAFPGIGERFTATHHRKLNGGVSHVHVTIMFPQDIRHFWRLRLY